MDIKEQMVMYRAKHGLSQERLAELCGLTKATVWNIESGRSNPTKLTIAKIKNVIEKEEQ
jgi:DNA-binding XRE family transcriptional regulator